VAHAIHDPIPSSVHARGAGPVWLAVRSSEKWRPTPDIELAMKRLADGMCGMGEATYCIDDQNPR